MRTFIHFPILEVILALRISFYLYLWKDFTDEKMFSGAGFIIPFSLVSIIMANGNAVLIATIVVWFTCIPICYSNFFSTTCKNKLSFNIPVINSNPCCMYTTPNFFRFIEYQLVNRDWSWLKEAGTLIYQVIIWEFQYMSNKVLYTIVESWQSWLPTS